MRISSSRAHDTARALAALSGFLARHPLRLVLLDRRRHVRYPRTAVAERIFAGYALGATLLLAAAFALTRTAFWPALVAAAPFALAALAYDALGRSREAAPEALGAVTLSATCAAIALAGGAPAPVAFAAWALLAMRSLTSVLYVRARIRLDRELPAGPGSVLAGHLGALVLSAAMARAGIGPARGRGLRHPARAGRMGSALPRAARSGHSGSASASWPTECSRSCSSPPAIWPVARRRVRRWQRAACPRPESTVEANWVHKATRRRRPTCSEAARRPRRRPARCDRHG